MKKRQGREEEREDCKVKSLRQWRMEEIDSKYRKGEKIH